MSISCLWIAASHMYWNVQHNLTTCNEVFSNSFWCSLLYNFAVPPLTFWEACYNCICRFLPCWFHIHISFIPRRCQEYSLTRERTASPPAESSLRRASMMSSWRESSVKSKRWRLVIHSIDLPTTGPRITWLISRVFSPMWRWIGKASIHNVRPIPWCLNVVTFILPAPAQFYQHMAPAQPCQALVAVTANALFGCNVPPLSHN